jgi:hypothetical protein
MRGAQPMIKNIIALDLGKGITYQDVCKRADLKFDKEDLTIPLQNLVAQVVELTVRAVAEGKTIFLLDSEFDCFYFVAKDPSEVFYPRF